MGLQHVVKIPHQLQQPADPLAAARWRWRRGPDRGSLLKIAFRNDCPRPILGTLLDDRQQPALVFHISGPIGMALDLRFPVARHLALQAIDLFQRPDDQRHRIDRQLDIGTGKLCRSLVAGPLGKGLAGLFRRRA